MGFLEKAAKWRFIYLANRIDIRSGLNVLGLVSDIDAYRKNKRDLFKAGEISKFMDPKDLEKLGKRWRK